MDTTERFTGKAQGYARYRPGYPAECIDDMLKLCASGRECVAADIGSGTGILSRELLERGLRVTAVEPNDDMRRMAETALGAYEAFKSVKGTAENTGICAHSIDLVTAAQAFHWFDRELFRKECRRILRPGAYVALFWNHRDPQSMLNAESADICARFCPRFRGFSGGADQTEDALRPFFADGQMICRTYRHDLEYSLEGFIGRNLSASYAPAQQDPERGVFVRAITALFEKHSRGGRVTVPNITRSYIGRV